MKLKISFLLLALTVSACVTAPTRSMSVAVDGISDPDKADLKTYIVVPGNPGVTSDDLQYKEYVRLLHAALQSRGFTPVADGENPQLGIMFRYEMDDPETETVTGAAPIFGQTGTSSSTTTGSVYGNSFSSYTTRTPTYGVVGAIPYTRKITTCMRVVGLDAIDHGEYLRSKKAIPAWHLGVVSQGTSCDLRAVLPFMLKAATPYIGVNTGKALEVEIALPPE